LLLQGGAVLAYVSGPLLLLFITGTGIALGTSAGKPSAHDRTAAARLLGS